jgi:hypothetical protein
VIGQLAGLESLARKHPEMWSMTTPAFCMNAYTLVGAMKRYPWDFSRTANAVACGVVVGTSATVRRARVRSVE